MNPYGLPYLPGSGVKGVLRQAARELADSNRWQGLLIHAFRHAFDWLGFGAKTAVGYGAMEVDPEVERRREQEAREAVAKQRREQEEAARQEARKHMTAAEREVRDYLDAGTDKNQPEHSRLIAGLKAGVWSGELKIEIATIAKAMMAESGKWKEASQAKRPEKDKDHQNTLLVMRWLAGQ